MRTGRLLCYGFALAGLTLLSPQSAFADLIVFHLDVDSGGGFEFDADSFRMQAPFRDVLGGENVDGLVELVSGPLVDVVPSEEGFIYTYGPGGHVSITATWTCGGEHWPCDLALPAEGSFEGTFESLTISTCEGCSVTFSGALADIDASLGAGLFSHSFAYLISGDGPSFGGSLSMPADGIQGEPGSTTLRYGGSASGAAELEVDAADIAVVPEPSATVLALASGVALLMRRRRAR
jgi:hypothetical protein